MKVLLINNHFEVRGGADRVFRNQWDLLQKMGHEVVVISTSEEPVDHQPDKMVIQTKKLNSRSFSEKAGQFTTFFYSRKNKKAFDTFIAQEKPDIAHLHIFYGLLSNSILSSLKKAGIPSIMTIHDYRRLCPAYTMIDGNGSICNSCQGKNYHHAIAKKCLKGSYLVSAMVSLECYIRDKFTPYEHYIDAFIMVSKFIQNEHVKQIPALKNKSFPIYNFIDLTASEPQNTPEGYFLFFGRLSHEKGLKTLIQCFKPLSNLKLVIAGNGPMEVELRQEVQGKEHISFTGFLEGTQLKEVLAKAKFVVVPSEWYENNPMSIVEAFALGKPVIGARIGGIPELVLEDQTGFMFESGDADSLQSAVTKAAAVTDSQYTELSANVRKFAEDKFDEGNFYNQLMELYQNLLESGK